MNQSTFVKLNTPGRIAYLRLQHNAGAECDRSQSGLCYELKLSAVSAIEKKGQLVALEFGTACPRTYQMMCVLHPALTHLSGPRIVEPEEHIELTYEVTATHALDLNALDWHLRLYLID